MISSVLTDLMLRPISGAYLALHTTERTELAGRRYARSAGPFDDLHEFYDLPAARITHAALWSAATGGELLCSVPFMRPITTQEGDGVVFQPGDIEFGIIES